MDSWLWDFGAVTIFVTIGPPIALYAFRVVGELTVGNGIDNPNNTFKTRETPLSGTPS